MQEIIQEDNEVIKAVLSGKDECYSLLVDRYKDKLFSYLYSMVGDRQDAQDLTQEVLVKAFFKLDLYTGESRFWTWLYRIATNHGIDWLRKRNRRPIKAAAGEYLEENNRSMEESRNPENQLILKEQRQWIRNLIADLPESYRVVFLLRYNQQLSCKDIGHVLNLSENQVRTRLHRARRKLQKAMQSSREGGEGYELFNF